MFHPAQDGHFILNQVLLSKQGFREGLERWVRNHRNLFSSSIFWKMHYCKLDAEGSISLGAKTKPSPG